jgi:hypothetical protein
MKLVRKIDYLVFSRVSDDAAEERQHELEELSDGKWSKRDEPQIIGESHCAPIGWREESDDDG